MLLHNLFLEKGESLYYTSFTKLHHLIQDFSFYCVELLFIAKNSIRLLSTTSQSRMLSPTNLLLNILHFV